MGWINRSAWWLLIMTVCSGNRIFDAIQSSHPQPPWNQMVDLVKQCFIERAHPIVVTEDLVDALFGTSRDLDLLNLNVIDHKYKSKHIQIFNPGYPIYILSAKSAEDLETLLRALKSSPTWSISSVFFIVGTHRNSCENSSRMLKVLWKMNLISSFYVCSEPDNPEIMMLYMYNPFNNQAPESWVPVESADDQDEQWNLFKQPYANEKGICRSLADEKTKALNGHEVKVVGSSDSDDDLNKSYPITSLRNSTNYRSKIAFFENLFSAMNVTPTITYEKPGLWMKNKAFGFLKNIQNGTYDISTDSRTLDPIERIDMVKMHHQNYLMILTQRINLVKSDNTSNFLNPAMIAVSVLILFITFVIIIFNNDGDFGSGFLDIIQLSLSSGIDAPLDRISVRVIFLATTLFVSIVFPEIQGQIFSYSTNPERRYPQNLEDLRDFKFNIHYHYLLNNYMSAQQKLLNLNETLLHSFDYYPPTCHDIVLNNSLNACISPVAFQLFSAEQYDLHLVQEKLNPFYVSHWTRQDWVMKKKVDDVVSRFRESGLLDKWDKLDSRNIIEKSRAREIYETSGPEYDEIDFENLIPVYVFVGLCFTFGILIFVAEIMIVKYKIARRKKIYDNALKKRVVYAGGRFHLIK